MKTFKDYLTESKRSYGFRVKIADTDLDGDVLDKIERALSAYQLNDITKPRRGPVSRYKEFAKLGPVGCEMLDVVTNYPGRLYLIPQNVFFDAGSIAAYLACFDGHKKVFLIGFDNYADEEPVNNIYKDTANYPTSDQTQNGAYFARSLAMVMNTYNDVDFIRVMPTNTWALPYEWQAITNLRQMDYREFAIEADLG